MTNDQIADAVSKMASQSERDEATLNDLNRTAGHIVALIKRSVSNAGVDVRPTKFIRLTRKWRLACDLHMCAGWGEEGAQGVFWLEADGVGQVYATFSCPYCEDAFNSDLDACMALADDVAGGLLDEISGLLEERRERQRQAAKILMAAE